MSSQATHEPHSHESQASQESLSPEDVLASQDGSPAATGDDAQDYSTLMEAILGNEGGDLPSAMGQPKDSGQEEDEEEFVYEGVDAEPQRAYGDQLRDILGAAHEEDELDEGSGASKPILSEFLSPAAMVRLSWNTYIEALSPSRSIRPSSTHKGCHLHPPYLEALRLPHLHPHPSCQTQTALPERLRHETIGLLCTRPSLGYGHLRLGRLQYCLAKALAQMLAVGSMDILQHLRTSRQSLVRPPWPISTMGLRKETTLTAELMLLGMFSSGLASGQLRSPYLPVIRKRLRHCWALP